MLLQGNTPTHAQVWFILLSLANPVCMLGQKQRQLYMLWNNLSTCIEGRTHIPSAAARAGAHMDKQVADMPWLGFGHACLCFVNFLGLSKV